MGVGALIFLLVLATAVSHIGVQTKTETEAVKTTSTQAILAQTAQSGLHLAKEALLEDDDWSDCLEANVNCAEANEFGFYPLYSPPLEEDISDYDLNNMKLTVLIRPRSRTRVDILSIAEKDGKRVVLAAKFHKVRGSAKVPIAYGGSSFYFTGGRLCSYYWDGEALAGETLPNLSVYLQDNFRWSPEIVVPRHPAGPNPKDVRFYTNRSTTVRGYRVIDKLFSTGDVYLQWGAHVGYVSANGEIHKDWWSSCDTCLEHQSWEYPNLSPRLSPLTFPTPAGSSKTYTCNGQTVEIVASSYRRLTFRGSGKCYVKLIGGDTLKARRIAINGAQVVFNPADGNVTTLEVNRLVVDEGKIILPSDEGSIILKAKRLYNTEGEIVCKDPRYCLIDTNYVRNTEGVIKGIVMARNELEADEATFIGNLIVEDASVWETTVCNIVDASGEQVLPQVGDFFDVVDPEGDLTDPVVLQVWSTICGAEVADCIARLD